MGEPITARDALGRFLVSTASVLALLDDLSDADWRACPDGEPWSLAQTIEHLVVTNQAALGRLRAKRPKTGRPALHDEAITARMFEGLPPPPGVPEPTGRWSARADGVAALTDVRDAIEAEVRASGDALRDVAAPHPAFGLFDGVQWLLFAAAHTSNHLPQLERLRDASP